MKTIFSSLTALLVGFLVTPFLHAETVDWSSTLAFTVNNGIESPTVLFGFNPQPEPPPELVSTGSIDPSTATQELSGVSPQPFLLYTAAEGGRFSFPPEPVLDFNTLSVPFMTVSGTDLTFMLTFTPTGDGDASSGISDPLFFNPQPEPPPQFADDFGFQFAFNDLSGVDTVSVSLQVLDESGRALEIQAVPLPPALLLFISGIASLIGLAGTGAGIGRFNSRKPDPIDSL